MRQPKIGDKGAIVTVLNAENFIIESVNEEGYTVWVADFHIDEIELFKSYS